jgi:pilus assembly protein CpaE
MTDPDKQNPVRNTMFPLPVILIGVGDHVLPGLRQELANASASVEAVYGSGESVIKALSSKQVAKKLLVVPFGSVHDTSFVTKLAQSFRSWPILALVEGNERAENIIRANRAGATQMVSVPIQSSDFREAMNSIALAYLPAERIGSVLAFTGTAAGCGATSLATNAASEIAMRYKRQTVLIELAAQMGVVATNIGIEAHATLADLLADQDHLDAELVRHSLVAVNDHFRVLAGSRDVAHGGSIPVAGALRVVDYVRSMADVVVLDVPCTYDDFQFQVLGSANHVILVGEQSITSIRTLKLILDAHAAGAGSPSYHVVMNRYNPAIRGLGLPDLQRVLGLAMIHTIPDDRLAVLAAANEGRLLRQINPHSPVLAAIDSLLDSLLGGAANGKQAASKNLVYRLFHPFTK